MNEREIVVRFASENDLEWCDRHDDYASTAALARKIAEKEVILAEFAHQPIGLLRFEFVWTTQPLISQLKVMKSERGRGVARAMLRFFESFLIGNGYRLVLSSTMPDNLLSQNWHRKAGFRECGFWSEINRDGVGEIFYRKDL